MSNFKFSKKKNKLEAMALANLNDEQQWLSLLYQYVHDLDKSMTNTNTSLLRLDLFDWQTVAKETLEVFNGVVRAKK